MLKIVWNNFSESPRMECMLKIVWNNFSEPPWMERMLKIVWNNFSELFTINYSLLTIH